MSRYRKILQKVSASLLFIVLISISNFSFAADGEALFKANCANCHKPLEDYTGPKLQMQSGPINGSIIPIPCWNQTLMQKGCLQSIN